MSDARGAGVWIPFLEPVIDHGRWTHWQITELEVDWTSHNRQMLWGRLRSSGVPEKVCRRALYTESLNVETLRIL